MSETHTLGQFIPLIYHYNMLSDEARMSAFKEAIADVVQPGHTVLELGGDAFGIKPNTGDGASRIDE